MNWSPNDLGEVKNRPNDNVAVPKPVVPWFIMTKASLGLSIELWPCVGEEQSWLLQSLTVAYLKWTKADREHLTKNGAVTPTKGGGTRKDLKIIRYQNDIEGKKGSWN